jgi:hypothetical protein
VQLEGLGPMTSSGIEPSTLRLAQREKLQKCAYYHLRICTRGLISLWLYKEKIIYGTEKIYLLYIFPLEHHTLMTPLF